VNAVRRAGEVKVSKSSAAVVRNSVVELRDVVFMEGPLEVDVVVAELEDGLACV